VHAGNEFAVFAENVEHLGRNARHYAHIHYYIRGVGYFDANLGDWSAYRAHAEGNDVHRAPFHAAAEKFIEFFLHFGGIHPVVGRTCVSLGLGANEGARFHAGYVARVGAEIVASGAFLLVELDAHSLFDHLIKEFIGFLLGAVAPYDAVGRRVSCPVVDPGYESLVFYCLGIYHYYFSPCLLKRDLFIKIRVVFTAENI